jgi:hypothetical protein
MSKKTMESGPKQHLAEIFQVSGVLFAFVTEDGKSQATCPCKCRDFMSDVLSVNWGFADSASIYGFSYSKSMKADTTKLTVENLSKEKMDLAVSVCPVPISADPIKIGGKDAFEVDIGDLGKSTIGVSAITHLIRCCDFADTKKAKTVEDVLKSPTSGTDKQYSTSILGHGCAWFSRVMNLSDKIGEVQRKHKKALNNVHNYGGIHTLATGTSCWMLEFGEEFGCGRLTTSKEK